uniref:PMEI domain-containing protein n=1 Tax=Syphacia muris TaxID=451379 RepID=A0A0N5AAX1_9BILA
LSFVYYNSSSFRKLLRECVLTGSSKTKACERDTCDETSTSFTESDFENAANMKDLADEVAKSLLSKVSENDEDVKKVFEGSDFSELIGELDSETRDKYTEACNTVFEKTGDTLSSINSFEFDTFMGFSEVFLAAYHDLKKDK